MPNSTDLYHRVRYLPGAIERAEAKLAALYLEAKSYSMDDLSGPDAFDEAWERAIQTAQTEAALRGEENTLAVTYMGEARDAN